MSGTSMTHSKYLRFVWVACSDVFFTVPLGIFVIWINATKFGPITPWPCWSAVHWGFNNVYTLTFDEMTSKWSWFALYWNHWINVFCSTSYVINFGTTDEMRAFYARCFYRAVSVFGFRRQVKDVTLPSMVFETVLGQGAGSLRSPYVFLHYISDCYSS